MLTSILTWRSHPVFPIVVVVMLLHMLLLWYSTIGQPARPVTKPKEKLIVKTVSLREETPVVTAKQEVVQEEVKEVQVEAEPEPEPEVKKVETPPPAKAKVEPKKTAPAKPKKSVVQKKQAKPAPPKKKEVVAPKPKPAVDSRRQQLLSAAKKSIASVKQSAKPAVADSALPITTFELPLIAIPEDQWNDQERGYYDELSSRLKLLLRLPEYGEVKVKLTLARTGKFIKAAITQSKSKKNHDYIEEALPKLTYPSFGSYFGNVQEYTFILSLSNDL